MSYRREESIGCRANWGLYGFFIDAGSSARPIAKPVAVVAVSDVPKSRPGKILRRLLAQLYEQVHLGETTSLQNVESINGMTEAVSKYYSKGNV